MEERLHLGLQDHLHDRLRHAICDRRNAKWARAAVVLRYLDKPHGRRKVRARRHPVPDLVEVVLQALLERRQRLPVHSRSSVVRLHPLIRLPNELLRNHIGLASGRGSFHRWLTTPRGRDVGPLRSTRITRLHRYLEPARPCTPHRYSAPHGSAAWRSPLASECRFPRSAREPVLGSRRLCAGHRPDSKQATLRTPPRLCLGAWFRWRLQAFDTVPTVHSRSSSQHSPDGFRPAFSENAHYPGHCAEAASGGLGPDPAVRARGAVPHLSCSKHIRQVIDLPPAHRGAPGIACRKCMQPAAQGAAPGAASRSRKRRLSQAPASSRTPSARNDSMR
jgi:hypothetical protein